MLAPPGATVAVVVFPAPASDVLVSLPPMLAPPGATVAVVVLFVVVAAPVSTAGLPVAVVVFPAPASDVLVSLPPMLAPPGATVAVVVLFVVVAAPVSTAGLPVAVVVFCDKQSDCVSAVVVVTFVPLAAGPNDVPLGAGVAAVSLPLPPVACTGLVGAADINVSTSKTVGKAIVAMNLREILGFIAVFFLSGLLLLLLIS